MPDSYVVRCKDNLWSISRKFNVSFQELKALNPQLKHRTPAYGVNPGDVLKLPPEQPKGALKKICATCPVPTATLEILDENKNVATFVRIGLWDHAFDSTGTLYNQVVEADNFCGADSRRLYIRVKDPDASGASVEVKWKTLKANCKDLDNQGSQLTLIEEPAGSKTFVSKGLILVCDEDDANQDTDSGLSAPFVTGARTRAQSNHRTKLACIDGFIYVEYTPASGPRMEVELPVFKRDPEERRHIPIQVFVLRTAVGGPPVIPTAAASALFSQDLRVMRECYERVGMQVRTITGGAPAANQKTSGDFTVVEIDPVGIDASGNSVPVANPANVTLADEANLGRKYPAVGHTIRIFFTGGLASNARGESAPDVDYAGKPDQGTAFIDNQRGPYTVAHESGHMLTNKSSGVNDGHYKQPTAPAGHRFFNDQNLMRDVTSTAEGIDESKRIWNVVDGDGNQQLDILSSPYSRPF